MNLALLIVILRIVPYAIGGYVAWRKGYSRLVICCLIGVGLAAIAVVAPHERLLADALRASFAFFLFWHAMDIPFKKGS